jgi:hypothetical protein
MRFLLGSCLSLRRIRLRILPAESLYASGSIDQALFAGKEGVANRANFHVNVALVSRPGLKVASACAKNAHGGVMRMDFFLGHLFVKTFPAIYLL